MAKPELGTKRIDPETGKKFYDLNNDPIVSPYTGISYPVSYFESSDEAKNKEDETEEKGIDTILEKPEFISLDDGDDKDDDLPDLGDDDTFLATDEDDEDDDVTDIIGGGVNDDDDI